MDLLHAASLAVIQGLTEFLPVSSSGHLVLVPYLLGWPDQGLQFDVAVHLGSMVAIIAYFRRDFLDLLHVARTRDAGAGSRGFHLGWLLIIATIPAGLAAVLLGDSVESTFRNPTSVALSLIVFGLLLWWADAKSKRNRDFHALDWRGALLIGCAQAIALIPGTSRSGITITAGLMLGLTREASAQFAFLMAVPVIFLAGAWETVYLLQDPEPPDWQALLVGFGVSAGTAYLCIHWFLKFVRRYSLVPFVIYRLVLGAALLVFFR